MDIIARGLAVDATEKVVEVRTVVESLPRGLIYKGAVNYQNNLPTDAEIGDTYTVLYKGTSGAVVWDMEFAWGEYQGVERWIPIGAEVPENVSAFNNDAGYQTASDVASAVSGKQDELTAGTNITISNNVISATDTTYTAGTNITIDSNNVISASGGVSTIKAGTGASAEVFNGISPSKATGPMAHAENFGNATGSFSHAEGYETYARGSQSHAEGEECEAVSSNSHAEGQKTQAQGDNSHAEGRGTKARSSNQHAQGKYNVEDSNNTYADIVGNGTDDTHRSNASALGWDGNLHLKGNVYVGCNDDSTGGTMLGGGASYTAGDDIVIDDDEISTIYGGKIESSEQSMWFGNIGITSGAGSAVVSNFPFQQMAGPQGLMIGIDGNFNPVMGFTPGPTSFTWNRADMGTFTYSMGTQTLAITNVNSLSDGIHEFEFKKMMTAITPIDTRFLPIDNTTIMLDRQNKMMVNIGADLRTNNYGEISTIYGGSESSSFVKEKEYNINLNNGGATITATDFPYEDMLENGATFGLGWRSEPREDVFVIMSHSQSGNVITYNLNDMGWQMTYNTDTKELVFSGIYVAPGSYIAEFGFMNQIVNPIMGKFIPINYQQFFLQNGQIRLNEQWLTNFVNNIIHPPEAVKLNAITITDNTAGENVLALTGLQVPGEEGQGGPTIFGVQLSSEDYFAVDESHQYTAQCNFSNGNGRTTGKCPITWVQAESGPSYWEMTLGMGPFAQFCFVPGASDIQMITMAVNVN